jgi:hypothetical protein
MRHPKKKLAKQKRQSARDTTRACEPPDNTARAGYYSRHSRWRPYKKKNRHPRVRLPIDVFVEWRRVVYSLHPKPEAQILEEMMKATELLYANMTNGQVTIAVHASNVETPLTHAFLLTRVCLTEKGEPDRRNIWVNATPEACFRARNVARFTDMPINVVFSIAIYLAALLSRPSTAGLKAVVHVPFFG